MIAPFDNGQWQTQIPDFCRVKVNIPLLLLLLSSFLLVISIFREKR